MNRPSRVHTPKLAVAALRAALVLATCGAASAQCTNFWKPGDGLPGFDRDVWTTTTWDPDGAGPRGPVVVFGGAFEVSGPLNTPGVATWDPVTGSWEALGAGIQLPIAGTVSTLVAMPNGDLIAGGEFSNGIVRWNGSTWQPLGAGPGGVVASAKLMPNGDVLAGGGTTSSGFVSRWDGTTWTQLGTFSNLVRAVAFTTNGDIVAGGSFLAVGTVAANRIARFDGTTWSPLGAGMNFAVRDIVQRPNGDILAAGDFSTAGTVAAVGLARWDGTTWSSIGTGLAGSGLSLRNLANGDTLVAGSFTAVNGIPTSNVARWDGTTWFPYSPGPSGTVRTAMELPNGDLVVGGSFTSAGGQAAVRGAIRMGTNWRALAPGMSAQVTALAAGANGTYVAGGDFLTAGSTAAQRVARWDGTAWTPLGAGPAFQSVSGVTVLANGDIVAGGVNFTPPSFIARWDGSSWSPLGAGVNGQTYTFLQLPNGDLIVGGRFNTAGGAPANFVARWNGATWSPLGSGMNSGSNAVVRALTRTPNGDIIAGGFFATAGGVNASHIARWDGTNWSPLGSGMNFPVLALCTLPDGSVVAGGDFTTAGGNPALRVARWDGSSWQAMGSGIAGSVQALTVQPNGDVIAGAWIVGTTRWNGTAWSSIGVANQSVNAVVTLSDGDVVAGGPFLLPGRAYVARLSTTCPASADTYGTACTSSVGTMDLRAHSLPWIGGTMRTVCSSIAPTNALVLGVLGASSAAVPLSALHPAGVTGCSLLANLDITLFLAPSQGEATLALTIPVDTALVGAVLRHQALQFELDAQFQITRFAGSNGLTLTVGMF